MIMPMAGRGSRFAKNGACLPKPLLQLADKPFFYWATLGVIRELPKCNLVYVVLREHVEKFHIDDEIRKYFPHAQIVILNSITSGALETALKASEFIDHNSLLLVNDCDHAFSYPQIHKACDSIKNGADAFLSHFHSIESHFSFAQYSSDGLLLKTAEKEIISDLAIAGIYGFKNFVYLRKLSELYAVSCPYSELFISGVYNEIIKNHGVVYGYKLAFHVSFGTPFEYDSAKNYLEDIKALEA
jgi:dTDP-glucose pyrophosphorylase